MDEFEVSANREKFYKMKPLILTSILLFLFNSYAYPQDSNKKVDWNKIERRLYKELKEQGGKSDAEIHQVIGYGLMETDSPWERAAVHFKKAVELDPKLYQSWYNLGIIHMDTEEGDEYFKKSIEINPFYSPPYYWLAYSYCRSRKDKKAIPVFEKYLEVAEAEGDPNEVDRVRVAKKVLKELHSGIEGKNLSMMRRPLREKKK